MDQVGVVGVGGGGGVEGEEEAHSNNESANQSKDDSHLKPELLSRYLLRMSTPTLLAILWCIGVVLVFGLGVCFFRGGRRAAAGGAPKRGIARAPHCIPWSPQTPSRCPPPKRALLTIVL